MIALPFRFEHVDLIGDPAGSCLLRPTEIVKLEGPNAYSLFADDECIGCGGVVKLWPGRYAAWAHVSSRAAPHILPMVKFVRSVIQSLGEYRVEAAVPAHFKQGQKFARLCGFKLETPEPARRYLPDGGDAYLYAAVSP